MQYDFEKTVNRHHTGSLKWDKYTEQDILPLWVADMDCTSAPEILDALKTRVDHGIFGYTIPYKDVEEAVIAYLDRVHNYSVDREWLVWLPGLVPALNVTCRAFGEEGDAVMTSTPVYPPFLSAPKNQHKTLITTALKWDDKQEQWTFDFDAMEAAVTSRTKLFILCNPHNPVGRVYTREELLHLAAFCEKHDLILCSDEIHCDLILDTNSKHTCTATLGNEIAARTITLMAPSKTYNIPGLACSFAIIEDNHIRNTFKQAANGLITEVNALGYAACAAAYRLGEPWRQALITHLRSNRDFLYNFIETRIPEIKLKPMQATYLAWLDTSELGLTSPTAHFEQYGIGLSDGRFFSDSNHQRLNFGCPRKTLEEGLLRLEKAVIATR